MDTFSSFYTELYNQINLLEINDPVAYFESQMREQFGRNIRSYKQIIKDCEDILQENCNFLITKRHVLFLSFAFHFNAVTTSRLLEASKAGTLYARDPYDFCLMYALNKNKTASDFLRLQQKCEELFDTKEKAQGEEVPSPYYTVYKEEGSRAKSTKLFTISSILTFLEDCQKREDANKENQEEKNSLTLLLSERLITAASEDAFLESIEINRELFRNNHERALRILCEHFIDFLYASLPVAAEICADYKEPEESEEPEEPEEPEESEEYFETNPLWPILGITYGTASEFKEKVSDLAIEMVEINREFHTWIGTSKIAWNISDWYIRSGDSGLRAILTGNMHLSRETFLAFIAFFVHQVRRLQRQRANFKEVYPSLTSDDWKQPEDFTVDDINEQLEICGFGKLRDSFPDDKLYIQFFENSNALSLEDADFYCNPKKGGAHFCRLPYDIGLCHALQEHYILKQYCSLQKECDHISNVKIFSPPFAHDYSVTIGCIHRFLRKEEERANEKRELIRIQGNGANDLFKELKQVQSEQDLLSIVNRNKDILGAQHFMSMYILNKHFESFLIASRPAAAEQYLSKSKRHLNPHNIWETDTIEGDCKIEVDTLKKKIHSRSVDMDHLELLFENWVGTFYEYWTPADRLSKEIHPKKLLNGKTHTTRTAFLLLTSFFVYQVRVIRQQKKRALEEEALIKQLQELAKQIQRKFGVQELPAPMQAITVQELTELLGELTKLTGLTGKLKKLKEQESSLNPISFHDAYPSLKPSDWNLPKNTSIEDINRELADCGFSMLSPDFPEDKVFYNFFNDENALALGSPLDPLDPLVDFQKDKKQGRKSKLKLR